MGDCVGDDAASHHKALTSIDLTDFINMGGLTRSL